MVEHKGRAPHPLCPLFAVAILQATNLDGDIDMLFSTIGAMATISLFFISLNEFRVVLGIVADPMVSRDLRNILSVFAQHMESTTLWSQQHVQSPTTIYIKHECHALKHGLHSVTYHCGTMIWNGAHSPLRVLICPISRCLIKCCTGDNASKLDR